MISGGTTLGQAEAAKAEARRKEAAELRKQRDEKKANTESEKQARKEAAAAAGTMAVCTVNCFHLLAGNCLGFWLFGRENICVRTCVSVGGPGGGRKRVRVLPPPPFSPPSSPPPSPLSPKERFHKSCCETKGEIYGLEHSS